jgi:type II secretory pathway predicted ATPase ExeA
MTSIPFHNAPDPYFFFPSRQHQKALDLLLQFLRGKKGLFLLMGKIGTGKTTLCKYIQQKYSNEFTMLLFSNPFLTPSEFEKKLRQDLGLDHKQDFFTVLQKKLLSLNQNNKNPVLFLDEGHLLSQDLFEFLLILSNLQSNSAHLLQIVLAGQPEMENLLQQPRFASLYQRIGGRIFLTGLSCQETRSYILYRLHKAKLDQNISFSLTASLAIHKWTKGIPRLINKACDLCLEHLKTTTLPGQQKKITYPFLLRAVIFNSCSTFYPLQSKYGFYLNALAMAMLLVLLPSAIHCPERVHPLGVHPLVAGNNQSQPNSRTEHLKQTGNKVVGADSISAHVQQPVSGAPRLSPPRKHIKEKTTSSVTGALSSQESNLKKRDSLKDNRSKAKTSPAQQPDKKFPGSDVTRGIDKKFTLLQNGLELSAIVWSPEPEQRCAVINNMILHQNDTVYGYKIMLIEQTQVKLQKNGQYYLLKIKTSG